MKLLPTVYAFTAPDFVIACAREVSRGKTIGIEKEGNSLQADPAEKFL